LKLDHVTLAVSSLAESMPYYDALLPLLGFVKRREHVWTDGVGFYIQFLQARSGTRPYERYGAGLNHLGSEPNIYRRGPLSSYGKTEASARRHSGVLRRAWLTGTAAERCGRRRLRARRAAAVVMTEALEPLPGHEPSK